MGIKYERRTLIDVETTAEGLQEAASHLVGVASAMREAGMDTALFPWTKRQWDAFDLVAALAAQCAIAIPLQVKAKAQGRPSIYEEAQKKSARDAVSRKKRQSLKSAAGQPKRARGRPIKGAEKGAI